MRVTDDDEVDPEEPPVHDCGARLRRTAAIPARGLGATQQVSVAYPSAPLEAWKEGRAELPFHGGIRVQGRGTPASDDAVR
jgi:hypothetical protein